MTIDERLAADLKEAMKAGDRIRIEAIRGARAALQSARLEAAKARYEAAARDIEQRFAYDPAARDAALAAIDTLRSQQLDPETEIAVLMREVKRRQEAAELYRKGGRPDLAAKEEAEIAILESYLPRMLSADEIRPEVAAIITELGLSGPAAMGQLMPVLMERFKGRAEGRVLSQVARELLTGAGNPKQ